MTSIRGGNVVVNTIPVPKLTTMLNDFIVKTVNDLNKLSVHVENKLSSFDNKLREMEIMVTLLEAKLNSLPPEITSKYPDLTYCSLNDINPVINPTTTQVEATKPVEPIVEVQSENKNGENLNNNIEYIENNNPSIPEPVLEVEETPEQKLKNFLEKENSEDLQNMHKMLKFGIPEQAVRQKAMITDFDPELLTVSFNILINVDVNRVI